MLRRAVVMTVSLLACPRVSSGQVDFKAEMAAYARRRGPILADSVRRILDGPALDFDRYVALENAILAEPEALQASGALQYARLLVVAWAERFREQDSSTLARSWRLMHDDVLLQSPFESNSYPRAEPFWKIVDKNRKAPWAEEVAWHAAQLHIPTDECTPNCVLGLIIHMDVPYWNRFPTGEHSDTTVSHAVGLAKYATDMACPPNEPNAMPDFDFSGSMAATIRRGLVTVKSARKVELLRLLAAGEAKCRKPTTRKPR